jgi:spore coat protein U-like protein
MCRAKQARERIAAGAIVMAAAACLGASRPAAAATAVPTTANFLVSATVTAGCWVVGSISQTSGIGFGMLDFGTHPAVQGGTYTAAVGMAGGSPAQVQCTPGATVTMTIDAGQNALGAQRRMRSGAHYLPYHLTTLPGGGVSIAPGTGISVDASAGPTVLPVHGAAVAPGTGLPAGLYTDTVQVVFSW